MTQLSSVFQFFIVATAGHFVAALVLYLNHRFIFHGKLGSLPFLRNMRRLHTLHHRHTFDDEVNQFLKTPLWGKLSLSLVFILSGFIISPAFGIGLFTFALAYAYRHRAAHNGDVSRFALHHMGHHLKATVNFSGVYPLFDQIFFTYEDPK